MATAAQFNHNVIEIQRSGIRRFTEEAAEIPDCLFLTLGEPDFNTPDTIRNAAKAALDQNMTHYPPNNGIAALREKISCFEQEQYSLSYQPDEIIITNGAAQGIAAALYSILEPGDEVIIPTPAFPLYEALTKLAGGVPVFADTSRHGFELPESMLSAAISPRSKVLVLTSPNNPTGHVYCRDTLEMVRRLAQKYGLFILCDDVYRALIYTDDTFSFAQFQDLRDQIIVAQSFSKPYAMTGWRVGYLMSAKSVIDQISKTHQYMVSGISHFSQAACIVALDQDISLMLKTYRSRRELVCRRLRQMHMEFQEPNGAFYLFPSIRSYGMDSLTFCRRLAREQKVALVPGIFFGSDDHVRISYCVAESTLIPALDRLEAFLHQIDSTSRS